MDNLFRPGKWLVLFCGVFLLLFGVLQYVSNARLKQEAMIVAERIFTWMWSGDNLESQAKITDADVVQKGANDAIVKVKGKQTLTSFAPGATFDRSKPTSAETMECAATLHFYKMSMQNKDYWMLGKVEFQ